MRTIELVEHLKIADGVLGSRVDKGEGTSHVVVDNSFPFCALIQHLERLHPCSVHNCSILDYSWDLELPCAETCDDFFSRVLLLALRHDLDLVSQVDAGFISSSSLSV